MSDDASVVSIPFPGLQEDGGVAPASVRRDASRASTDRVRVLHVINGEHYSGAARVQDLLAGYLPDFGYEVRFACVKPDRFPGARKFADAPLYALPMRSRFDLGCGRKLASLVRD